MHRKRYHSPEPTSSNPRACSRAPARVYVSDHGESLGENNLYLHGLPYRFAPDVQKHVPWISWFSPPVRAPERRGHGVPESEGG